MKFKDYYDVLGVKPDCDDAALKAAYRKQARKFHPDINKDPTAEERFKEVNEAHETLKDKKKRAAFDQIRASGVRPGEEFNPNGFGAGAGAEGFDQGAGFGDFFESMFGGGARGPRARTAAKGEDIRASFEVDLRSAFQGGSQRVSLSHKGHSRTLDVKVPAGVMPGQVIRLSGQGQEGMGGRGDLLLEVHIAPHAQFELTGLDVTHRVQLLPWEAALGCKTKVATLEGDVELAIPAGSNTGRKMRLRGRGYGKAGARGDQYVLVEIVNPAVLNDADLALYRKLADHFSAALTPT
jgi:curved DNA-binding protein